MDQERPPVTPLTGPCFCGTNNQGYAIQRLEALGWVFLYWTEIPLMLAVMEHTTGDIAFIDREGRAWAGSGFGKTNPVPLK